MRDIVISTYEGEGLKILVPMTDKTTGEPLVDPTVEEGDVIMYYEGYPITYQPVFSLVPGQPFLAIFVDHSNNSYPGNIIVRDVVGDEWETVAITLDYSKIPSSEIGKLKSYGNIQFPAGIISQHVQGTNVFVLSSIGNMPNDVQDGRYLIGWTAYYSGDNFFSTVISANGKTIVTAMPSPASEYPAVGQILEFYPPLARDTGLEVLLSPNQGAVNFGQVKITADVASEGALHVLNTHENGSGIYVRSELMGIATDARGPIGIGLRNMGSNAGVYNVSSNQGGVGQANEGAFAGLYNLSVETDGSGEVNEGRAFGQKNVGLQDGGIGQSNEGAYAGASNTGAFQAQVGVIDPASSITDVTGRVVGDSSTPFAGIGVQTAESITYEQVLDLIRLLVRKDPAVAIDLSAVLAEINANTGSGAGAYTPTTDSLEALHDRLSSSPIEINSVVDGSKITVFAADTWRYTVPVIHPAMSLAAEGVFVVKQFSAMSDANSTLLINTASGLLILNGAEQQDTTAGSLDLESDSFTVFLDSNESQTIQSGVYLWWLKVYDDQGDSVTVAEGKMTVRFPGVEETDKPE